MSPFFPLQLPFRSATQATTEFLVSLYLCLFWVVKDARGEWILPLHHTIVPTLSNPPILSTTKLITATEAPRARVHPFSGRFLLIKKRSIFPVPYPLVTPLQGLSPESSSSPFPPNPKTFLFQINGFCLSQNMSFH